jgi:hypothetical protein
MAFPLFKRTLFIFETEVDSPEAKVQLKKAIASNKFVVAK